MKAEIKIGDIWFGQSYRNIGIGKGITKFSVERYTKTKVTLKCPTHRVDVSMKTSCEVGAKGHWQTHYIPATPELTDQYRDQCEQLKALKACEQLSAQVNAGLCVDSYNRIIGLAQNLKDGSV
jgi:hypothetical protein